MTLAIFLEGSSPDWEVGDRVLRGYLASRVGAVDEYEGEAVDCHWEDFPNPGGNLVR